MKRKGYATLNWYSVNHPALGETHIYINNYDEEGDIMVLEVRDNLYVGINLSRNKVWIAEDLYAEYGHKGKSVDKISIQKIKGALEELGVAKEVVDKTTEILKIILSKEKYGNNETTSEKSQTIIYHISSNFSPFPYFSSIIKKFLNLKN